MPRNIVICCDGTANEFAQDRTNVETGANFANLKNGAGRCKTRLPFWKVVPAGYRSHGGAVTCHSSFQAPPTPYSENAGTLNGGGVGLLHSTVLKKN